MNNYMPTKLFTGINAIEKNIEEITLGKKCLIVTGKTSAKKSGALEDVVKALKKKEILYEVYDRVVANPLMSSCLEAGRIASDIHAEFIIGIGGGSLLDASKVIAVIATNPDITKEEIFGLKWTNSPLPLMLVGTTAGTGSEVTKVAIISDDLTGRKKSMHHDDYYAKLSFGDPRYEMSLNRDITLSTGIDALAHCVESYLTNKANEISKAYAVRGIKILVKELEKLKDVNYVFSIDEREKMYEGSILGGLAINITGTTFAHNLGYYITEQYHKAHGIACAIFMSDLIDFVEKDNEEYLELFFKEIEYSKEELFALVNSLLPTNDILMSEKEIDSIMPRYENNNSVKNTYGSITIEEIKEILMKKFVK